MSSKCVAAVPVEVASDLERAGLASELPLVRSSGVDVTMLVAGIQVTTTLVTFAQIPETIDYLSEALHRWWRREKAPDVQVEIRSKRGRVRLALDADTRPDDLRALLRLLAPQQQGKSAE